MKKKQTTAMSVALDFVALAFLILLPIGLLATDKESASVSAAEALGRLQEGNRRFVSGKLRAKNLLQERKALAQGQEPYVIILSCSDSRVPPELVFDESLGKLFIIRVAGNVADPVVLGSIEYAAEHLHSRLLLILGHESCGAVKATIAGGHVPPNIGEIVKRIQPAVESARSKNLDEDKTLHTAIEENVRIQMQNALDQSEVLKELVEKNELQIVGGVYNLHNGKVELLSVCSSSPMSH